MKDTCELHNFSPCDGPTSEEVYANSLANYSRLDFVYDTSVSKEHWLVHTPNSFWLSLLLKVCIAFVVFVQRPKGLVTWCVDSIARACCEGGGKKYGRSLDKAEETEQRRTLTGDSNSMPELRELQAEAGSRGSSEEGGGGRGTWK
jgi:hypothetical protein